MAFHNAMNAFFSPHISEPKNNTLLHLTLAFVLVLLLIATACDFRTREIPNWIAIAIAVAAGVAATAGWLGINLTLVIAGGALGLLVGYSLFRFAHLGGGDAKLIAALGLLLGPIGLLIVLFGMAITGGALALIAIYRKQEDYAYVPAIAAGFIGYLGIVSQF